MLGFPREVIWLIGRQLPVKDFYSFSLTCQLIHQAIFDDRTWQVEFFGRYPQATEDQVERLFTAVNRKLSQFIELPSQLFNRLSYPSNKYFSALRMLIRRSRDTQLSPQFYCFLRQPPTRPRIDLMACAMANDWLAVEAVIAQERADRTLNGNLTNLLSSLTVTIQPAFLKQLFQSLKTELTEELKDRLKIVLEIMADLVTERTANLAARPMPDELTRLVLTMDGAKIYQANQPSALQRYSDWDYIKIDPAEGANKTMVDIIYTRAPRIGNYLYPFVSQPITTVEQLLLLIDNHELPIYGTACWSSIVSACQLDIVIEFFNYVSFANYSDGDYPDDWELIILDIIDQHDKSEILDQAAINCLKVIITESVSNLRHPLVTIFQSLVAQLNLESLGDYPIVNCIGAMIDLTIEDPSWARNGIRFSSHPVTGILEFKPQVDLWRQWKFAYLLLPPKSTINGYPTSLIKIFNHLGKNYLTIDKKWKIHSPWTLDRIASVWYC